MPALYLTEAKVAGLVTMPRAIEIMAEAFSRLAAGEAMNVPRVRAQGKGIILHSMSATADYLGLVGWKQYTTTKSGATFLVGLHNASTGELVALIEASRLGQLRTGAVTGLAAKLLANPGANELGLFGTGFQAETQLAAVAAAIPLRRARVYGRNEARRREFAERMSRELELDVASVHCPRDAVEGLPLVCTATTSREPVFEGNWLAPGTLVCAVGSNWLNKAEIDVATVTRAQSVVCDSIAACQHEAGDFTAALVQGVFHWPSAVEFADVVAGKTPGRRSAEGIVLFKSVGLAIEDIALGAEVLRLARERGVGVPALPGNQSFAG
jgi:alanine dehydrogenase